MTLQYSIGIGFDGGSTVKATCRLWNGKITKYGTATAILSIPESITVNADLAWGYGSTTIDVTAQIGSTSYTKVLSLSGTVDATGVARNAANAVINTANNSFTANAYTSGSTSFVTYRSIGGSANGGAGTYTMHYDTHTITQVVTPSLGSIAISTKVSGTEVINGDLTITMTKGTPASTGGKAAAWAGSTKIGDIDIDDWWNEGVASVTIPTIQVDGTISIGDTIIPIKAIASNGEEATWNCNAINVWKGGYQAASDKVSYTSGAKSITVPSGDNNGTTPYDITDTFTAGLDACSMSVTRSGNSIIARLIKNGATVETKTYTATINDTHAVNSSGNLTGSVKIDWSSS